MCRKQEVAAVDQSEFLSMCGLIEARGLFAVKKAKETRLVKVGLSTPSFLPGSVVENAKPLTTLAQVVVIHKTLWTGASVASNVKFCVCLLLQVSLKIDQDELERALQDKTLVSSVLSHGL